MSHDFLLNTSVSSISLWTGQGFCFEDPTVEVVEVEVMLAAVMVAVMVLVAVDVTGS